MKIVGFEAENFKRIKAIRIIPTSNMIEITGRNAQGKSSILDGIWGAIRGKDAIQSDPIRHGEKEAFIKLDLEEYIAHRTFASKADGGYTTSLTVTSPEGQRLASPQKVLDALYGNLTFDPLNFMKMRPKEHLQYLKEFVEGIDFDAIDKAHQIDYDERQDINRDEKKATINAEAIIIPDDFIAERVEVDDLFKEIRDAVEHNGKIDQRSEKRKALSETITANRERVEEKRQQCAELQERLTALENEMADIALKADEDQAKLDAAEDLPEKIDVDEIQAKMDTAKETNDMVDLVDKRAELMKEAEELKAKSDVLTESIDDRKAETKKAIEAIDMPVDGLDFGEDCILYKNVPFNQASDAEQLTVSIQMGMAMNPDLRVLRVRDGSLLDKASMELLTEMADTHDYQFWVERVSDDESVGIVIEDGSVKE